MKKLAIAFMLAAILSVIVISPAMADGPGNNGQGGDPSYGVHPPNDVWVPQAAWEARGEFHPGNGNENNNGAIFHGPGGVF